MGRNAHVFETSTKFATSSARPGDRFSAGWKKWDETGPRLAPSPFGRAMIRHANLNEDSRVLDVAAGTGEPGFRRQPLVPQGQ